MTSIGEEMTENVEQPNHLFTKRPFDSMGSNSEDGQDPLAAGYSAGTSVAPTPISPVESAEFEEETVDPNASLLLRPRRPTKPKPVKVKSASKLKVKGQPNPKKQKTSGVNGVKFSASSNPPAKAWHVESVRRRDDFFRAHAKTYLPLLPEDKNFVSNLLANSGKKMHREAVPYKLVRQPKSIVGGTLKDYQLAGLSFLAYMFENGQNCILADE